MRGLLILIILAGAMSRLPAQDAPVAPSPPPAVNTVVQTFTGTSSLVTPLFKVDDQWEIRWSCPGILNMTVFAEDGTIAGGAAIVHGGAIRLAKGGSYYLQIDRLGIHPSPSNNGSAMGTIWAPNTGVANAPPGSSASNISTNSLNALSPDQILAAIPWEVDVVQIQPGSSPDKSPSGVSYTPPDAAPGPGTAPPPAPVLTAAQTSAVVSIKGDNAQGTGFLVKMGDGPSIVTNLHFIADNPNLHITTASGTPIKLVALKGASDRDLALVTIEDAGYSYLSLADQVSNLLQPGDELVLPGNSPGGTTTLDMVGNVLGVEPLRVEFDSPDYQGNGGGPLFHTKSGKVVGVVTQSPPLDTSVAMDRISFQRNNPVVSGARRYFGLRLDNIVSWEAYDWQRFQNETIFLDQFHQRSRCLDSYLNTTDSTRRKNRNGAFQPQPPPDALDAKLYLTDPKIKKAHEIFYQQINGADSSQKLDAQRGLLYELQSLADDGMRDIQNPNNFYTFDRQRAGDEIDYRKGLKAELDAISNDPNRLSHLARSR